jgi:hypothetical protein
MLKAYQLAAAFAVVLLFLAMLGIAYYSSPPLNNPSEQRATAEQKFIAQRHEQSIVRPSFWNWLFPDSLSVFTMLLAISTVCLGIVAVIQLGFLNRQEGIAAITAKAAKESADVAKQTLVAAQRAWVRTDQIGFGGGGLAIDMNGASVSVSFKITNTGNSPAINVSPHAWLFVLKSGGPFPLQEQQRRCGEIRSQPFATGFTLFPGESFPSNIGIGNWSLGTNASREDIEEGATASADKKQILLYVFGCIDYTFPTDATTHHQTGFILEVRKDLAFPISLEDGTIPIARLS